MLWLASNRWSWRPYTESSRTRFSNFNNLRGRSASVNESGVLIKFTKKRRTPIQLATKIHSPGHLHRCEKKQCEQSAADILSQILSIHEALKEKARKQKCWGKGSAFVIRRWHAETMADQLWKQFYVFYHSLIQSQSNFYFPELPNRVCTEIV